MLSEREKRVFRILGIGTHLEAWRKWLRAMGSMRIGEGERFVICILFVEVVDRYLKVCAGVEAPAPGTSATRVNPG